ncbi:MAG TPA: transcription elongation factor GreA [Anaerolineaceae bacterium]|nr:transcription elongation factor GreA [Anaerolineaceae bacterium]
MPSSYLTRQGYEKSEQELEFLRTEKRKQVAARLQDAMEDGELIENAEYEDAKNEQAFVEGRIKELEILLSNAYIIDDNDNPEGTVAVGSTVTILIEGDDEPVTYMIVGATEANPRENRISNVSPIGHALLGKQVGDKVKVESPGGAFYVEILGSK